MNYFFFDGLLLEELLD